MQPSISDLSDETRFRLLKKINHKEIVHFVIENMRSLNGPMVFYYLFNLLILLLVVYFGFISIYNGYFGWLTLLTHFLAGIFFGMIVVIPFHELLHGLAYKIAGASKVKYGACFKQMIFYAAAPGFVAGKRQFSLVALLPFVTLNLVFIAGFILLEPAWKWASLIALLSHSSLCIGDFALMNFFAGRKNSEIFTFDDTEEETAYFYETVKEGG